VFLQTQEGQDSLNVGIEKQRTEARLHKEYLDSERERLRQQAEQVEADKCRARTERRLLRVSGDVERTRLEAEHERQLMEWAELEKERRHQLTLRQNDNIAAQRQMVCSVGLLLLIHTLHCCVTGTFFTTITVF